MQLMLITALMSYKAVNNDTDSVFVVTSSLLKRGCNLHQIYHWGSTNQAEAFNEKVN
jgi:hypothetical protein